MISEEKVKRAIKGDKEAFYEIIQENRDILYKTAFVYTKNQHDALEILDDTVYKAYISIKKLKQPQYFNTWLTRILINTSINYVRKQKKVVYLEENSWEQSAVDSDREELIDLYDAIDKLDDKYRMIVVLRYFQDLTVPQIAEVMECPLGTIKTYLHRALKQLRINLQEDVVNG